MKLNLHVLNILEKLKTVVHSAYSSIRSMGGISNEQLESNENKDFLINN